MKGKAVIIMGSERDFEFCREIAKHLKTLGVDFEFRVASAHKTPEKVLAILMEFEKEKIVYVTVAGRSNALSSFVDSSLRVPSGIGSVVTVEPEGAAIAAAKILAVGDEKREKYIKDYQLGKKKEIEKADETVKKLK